MSSGAIADGEAFTAAFDELDAAVDKVLGLGGGVLGNREGVAVLRRYERAERRLAAGRHPLINQLAREATPEELGGTLSHAIAEWAQISRAEAGRRGREGADLGARCGLTGEPLAPVLSATAAAQREGNLGREHVAVIRRFYHQLPNFIDTDTREHAEAHLAQLGAQYRPAQLAPLADRLAECLNPERRLNDAER